jgi:hypothetical protein
VPFRRKCSQVADTQLPVSSRTVETWERQGPRLRHRLQRPGNWPLALCAGGYERGPPHMTLEWMQALTGKHLADKATDAYAKGAGLGR